MLDQLKSRQGTPKVAKLSANGFQSSKDRGMSVYFKAGIVVVAVLLALVV